MPKWDETSITVSFAPDTVVNSNGKYLYKPEEGVTFLSNYRSYEDIFEKRLPGLAWWKRGIHTFKGIVSIRVRKIL